MDDTSIKQNKSQRFNTSHKSGEQDGEMMKNNKGLIWKKQKGSFTTESNNEQNKLQSYTISVPSKGEVKSKKHNVPPLHTNSNRSISCGGSK